MVVGAGAARRPVHDGPRNRPARGRAVPQVQERFRYAPVPAQPGCAAVRPRPQGGAHSAGGVRLAGDEPPARPVRAVRGHVGPARAVRSAVVRPGPVCGPGVRGRRDHLPAVRAQHVHVGRRGGAREGAVRRAGDDGGQVGRTNPGDGRAPGPGQGNPGHVHDGSRPPVRRARSGGQARRAAREPVRDNHADTADGEAPGRPGRREARAGHRSAGGHTADDHGRGRRVRAGGRRSLRALEHRGRRPEGRRGRDSRQVPLAAGERRYRRREGPRRIGAVPGCGGGSHAPAGGRASLRRLGRLGPRRGGSDRV